ncbi:hypothetical protein HAX54_043385, partial [Datura stramonium]|nr:hypothetical protein [Datura stramonium]
MSSNFDKGKEIEIANKSFKRLQKGTKGSSSSAKETPTRRFGEKAVEPHGIAWFNMQKKAKYAPKNWIDEGYFALEFPTIQDK